MAAGLGVVAGVPADDEMRRVIMKLTTPTAMMMRKRIQETAAARPKLCWGPQPSS